MKNILFIDSGSGGINVLAHCVKSKIAGNYLYFADIKNSPYGDKSVEELETIATGIIEKVSTFFKPDIVVFACNTLTTSAIQFVRKKYPYMIFVGTEPAMKLALQKYPKEDVLLMATNRTIENLKCEGLCVSNLPKLIDDNLFFLENLTPYLKENLKIYENKKAIVLGCTHYLAVKKYIQNIFPNCEIIDSNDGIAKRLKSFAGEGDYVVQFMSSGNQEISILSKYFQKLCNFS